MEIKFSFTGTPEPLHRFLQQNIVAYKGLFHPQEAPYKGSVSATGFDCEPYASTSSLAPRMRGTIESAGNHHTVTVRLRRMFRYHLLLFFVILPIACSLWLTIALSVEDASRGIEFSFGSLLLPLGLMLIIVLPFNWIWIVTAYNAKREMRLFCEQLVRVTGDFQVK